MKGKRGGSRGLLSWGGQGVKNKGKSVCVRKDKLWGGPLSQNEPSDTGKRKNGGGRKSNVKKKEKKERLRSMEGVLTNRKSKTIESRPG